MYKYKIYYNASLNEIKKNGIKCNVHTYMDYIYIYIFTSVCIYGIRN